MRRRKPDVPDHPLLHRMPCEEVNFDSRGGIKLGGWWIPAPNPRGTVILCSGQNGSMDKDVPQAVPLHQAGFNVLMFDFRAHGRSEGKHVTLGLLEPLDLLGAIDDLAAKRNIERVGVMGFSMGAGVALLAAARDRRIAALAADGAYPRLSALMASRIRMAGIPGPLAYGLAWLTLFAGSIRLHRLYRASPIRSAGQIVSPVLLIHGDLDPFVSSREIETLAGRIAGPVELWHVADAGHREAFDKHPDEYNRRVVEWFERHLE
jgi:alpha-beta hydrolase superfamily lysophospholipase